MLIFWKRTAGVSPSCLENMERTFLYDPYEEEVRSLIINACAIVLYEAYAKIIRLTNLL